MRQPPSRLCRRRDYVLSAVFIYLWLIPVLYLSVSDTSMPLVTDYLRYLHGISCLFNHRAAVWADHYFLVQLAGSKQWIAPAEEGYFRLQPFGHRNRMHQMFFAPEWHGMPQMQSLAVFVKTRFAELNPEAPEVVAVRFASAGYRTGEDGLARPPGRWRKPTLDRVDPQRVRVHSTHFFDGRAPLRGS